MATTAPILNSCETDGDVVALVLHIPHDLEYFDGHFPGHPIVPGVVQIKWVMDFSRRYFSLQGDSRKMEALKFSHVIMSGNDLILKLEYRRELNKIYFQYQIENAICSSGRIVLE
jgi:3-hydroxymyristoyl/3-hydroxydecanoyl-(acyl carrier protein) dehydratase